MGGSGLYLRCAVPVFTPVSGVVVIVMLLFLKYVSGAGPWSCAAPRTCVLYKVAVTAFHGN